MTCRQKNRSGQGFSLVELLVVMGLIAILVGGISRIFAGNGARGLALQSAQEELLALVGAARSQAVLHQVSARLLVYAGQPPGGESAKYLRCLQIVREEVSGNGRWIAGSDPVYLPESIFIVPFVVPATHLVDGLTWPAGASAPVSTLLGPVRMTMGDIDFGEACYVEYRPDGRMVSGVTKLAVATARFSQGTLPRFDNSAAVRGVRLRPAGTFGPVNGTGDF